MLFPPGSLQGPKVDTKKALLLLDLQNDFVASNGKLPVANTASFLPRLPALIAKFRDQGQIIFVRTVFQRPCPLFSPYTGGYNIMLRPLADYLRLHPRHDESITVDQTQDDDETVIQFELPPNPDSEAFLNDILPPSAQRCCSPGTKGADLSSQLTASIHKDKDMMLVKSQYSLFGDPMVVMQLRSRLISDLFICGSLSNVSVYATVLDAVQQGFNVTLVEDCLGYRDETCHVEAMKQMADSFGANGIDYAELMDDLHGLLGDVVPASKYTRTFHLSMQTQNGSQVSSSQRVNQWMDTIESESEELEADSEPERTYEQVSISATMSAKTAAPPPPSDSSGGIHNARSSPAPSPPRKRSTSDRDDTEEAHTTKSKLETTDPPSPPQSAGRPSLKKTRRESTTSKTSGGSTNDIPQSQQVNFNNIGQSQSTGHLEIVRQTPHNPQTVGRAMSQPEPLQAAHVQTSPSKVKKSKRRFDPTYLGAEDVIGENDSKIIHDVLPAHGADNAFQELKHNTAWQKMYHRTGEVPRLVAVQGTVDPSGAIPIYRHPADESPSLSPFDQTVDNLRKCCERLVGHALNHVLIQFYRSGEDNISEHSDKTLDILRGSKIVNLSLGAMRTMTLRTKKSSDPKNAEDSISTGTSRITHRIRLPHNSLFVLGERTNANWLHAVKADKRPDCEKTEEELSFDGERISLTFRLIGTFIDPKRQTIWGQGATCKEVTEAKRILQGTIAEEVGELMIIAFGKENHLTDSEFDWQAVYGSGFDVVNYEARTGG